VNENITVLVLKLSIGVEKRVSSWISTSVSPIADLISKPNLKNGKKKPGEGLYKVKGSKHFGYAFSVYSLEEAKEKLDFIKKEHHSARHHCYAYRLGLDKKVYRANDDGEPSSSAGKPILGQIQSFDLTNVIVIVVRYFGGTKLGVGGLIDAYRSAARLAIEDTEIVERQVKNVFRVKFAYETIGSVMKLLKDNDWPQENQQFEMTCTLDSRIRLDDSERFVALMEDIDGLELKIISTE